MPIRVGSSTAAPHAGVLAIGLVRAAVPLLGGTLLLTPIVTADVVVAPPQTSVGVPVPNTAALVGTAVLFQAVQIDAGASQGLAFTPGLEVRPVTR
jgi:hypothetical protein